MIPDTLAFREAGDSAGSCCPSVRTPALEKAHHACVLQSCSASFSTQIFRCADGFTFSHMSTLGQSSVAGESVSLWVGRAIPARHGGLYMVTENNRISCITAGKTHTLETHRDLESLVFL